ncbi:MAG: DUF551 domain-containing protein [Comamonas sp.]|uniref:DUF551 domain-containing protein n=1 Tax=Comamonas sp. TaxID=34028 RepID=UPI002647FE43|nr:DUF551 domain-containing protein [Comamonas sp.]MDN5503249.1 DUF551 domain-containing protein [Comamonas sp.]MDN5536477.1 DUF551 domain-containing protein [Comamonas sp.]
MSKLIEEVMVLVTEATCAGIDYGGAEAGVIASNCLAALHKAEAAVDAKLRELLPVWQPIESAPKDVCTEFDGWNGERVTNVSWGWPDYHPKEKRCWIRSVYETGYGWISEEVHGLTHWMPLPAPPSQEGAT